MQTEEYARAIFMMMRPPMADELIEQRVSARLARQEILSSRAAPLASFAIDEAVLRRPIGGRGGGPGRVDTTWPLGRRSYCKFLL